MFKGWILSVGTGIVFAFGSVAWAAPSLVLLEDPGSENRVHRGMVESWGALVVANNLGRQYDHIDVLRGEQATRERLFAQIRKRSARGIVDVLILTDGQDARLKLRSGDITEADIRAAGPFGRLRLVYMMARQGNLLEQAWRSAGAQLVVANQESTRLPGLFFPRFIRRWAEGASTLEASQEAFRFSEDAAHRLSGMIRESAIQVQGSDMREVRHSDFEHLSIQLLGGLVPQATLVPETIPSAQAWVDRVRDVAWEQLRDSFPSTSGKLADEEVWIDGRMIRFLLGSLEIDFGQDLSAILDRLLGARLLRSSEGLRVGIYFKEVASLPVPAAKPGLNWQPYSVHFPKAVRFKLAVHDGIVKVEGLDRGHDALTLKVKMPFLPDTIWIRQARLNLTNGHLELEGGIVGNQLAVVARGNILAARPIGIDLWATLERNLKLAAFPELFFQPVAR